MLLDLYIVTLLFFQNNDKIVQMNGGIIQEAEDTLSKFFSKVQQYTDVFNRNIDTITGALEDEYNEGRISLWKL